MAAHDAGVLLRDERERLMQVDLALLHDVKAKADKAAEELIRARLAPTEIPVIGEEFGGDPALLRGENLVWAVNPLDGP